MNGSSDPLFRFRPVLFGTVTLRRTLLDPELVDRIGLDMTSSGRSIRLIEVSALGGWRIWNEVRSDLSNGRTCLGNSRISVKRVDCFVDIFDYGGMLDADYPSRRDCVERSSSGAGLGFHGMVMGIYTCRDISWTGPLIPRDVRSGDVR